MMLASGACLVPLALTGQLWVAAGAYMAVMAAIACLGTSRDLFGQELVIPRWRTSSQGVAMIGMSLGWAAAGVIGGVLIDAAGFSALFLAGALAAFPGGRLAVRLPAARPQPSSRGSRCCARAA